MKRVSALLGCLVLLLASAVSAATLTDADRAKVDEIANAWIKSGRSAGLAIGVASDGQMLLAKGYGLSDIEHGVPMAGDSILLIGSITKQFTAAAVMQLAEQNKLSVDDPLSKYFPDFPQGSEVTIRHVLTHTSGIANYTGYDITREEKWLRPYTTEEMVKHIAAYQPAYDFPIGTAYRYSNSGFFIAGAIVEKVSGQPLRQYLQEQVFAKAGLKDTALEDDEREVVPRRADGYDAIKDKPGSYQQADFLDMTIPGGAGAMRSTVADLAAWHHALSTGKVVSMASYAAMTTPGKLKDGRFANENTWRPAGAPAAPAAGPRSHYGFGLTMGELNGHKTVGHSGGIQGFASYSMTLPDDHLTIVVLANTSGGAGNVHQQIARALLKLPPEPQP